MNDKSYAVSDIDVDELFTDVLVFSFIFIGILSMIAFETMSFRDFFFMVQITFNPFR